MGNVYQIALAEKAEQKRTLSFECSIHDDLFKILEKVDGKMDMTPEQTQAFIVGLKLFSEVMMQNRKHPRFKEVAAPFREFMLNLIHTGARSKKCCSPRRENTRVGSVTSYSVRSKRSAFITFTQAATKSFTNFSLLSSCA